MINPKTMKNDGNPQQTCLLSIEALAQLHTQKLPKAQTRKIISSLEESPLYQDAHEGMKLFLLREGEAALNELLESGVKSRNIDFFAHLMAPTRDEDMEPILRQRGISFSQD